MTALRLALSELRRLTAGRMPTLAVLAIVLIPTLYASLYLWANHDPYGKLSTVRAALVVEDVPAQSDQSGTIHAGRDVADDLVEDGSFDWQKVSAAEAAAGVEDGTFLFALTIPEGFSSALASTADFDPKQGELILTTNEANNYLSATIADQVLTRVAGSIAENVSERAASSFLLGFSTLHDQLKKAGAGAQDLADGLGDAQAGSQQLADGAAKLSSGQAELLAGQERLNAGLGDAAAGSRRLASGADDLADGAGRVATGADQVAGGAKQVAGGTAQLAAQADSIAKAAQQANDDLDDTRAQIAADLAGSGLTPEQQQQVLDRLDSLRQPLDDINSTVQQTDAKIDQLNSGAQQVSGGAAKVASGARQLDSGASTLSGGAGDLRDGLATAQQGSTQLVAGQRDAKSGADQLADGASTLTAGIGDAQAGAQQLSDGLKDGIASIPDLDAQQREDTAQAIASPIRTDDVAQAKVDSYGAGLAPFFMAIATWVGGYVMFLLVRPLSNRAIAARQSSWRTALGGWVTPAVLAAGQVIVMLTVVRSVVGISVLDTTQVAFFLLLIGATFVAIVHCLNAWLGAVGQLLGLVLLVLQLASAGGTFPWQTLPPALQAVHHVMPMSYAIDGIRHLMYGADLDSLPRDITVLLAYLVGSIALTTAAAYRRRIWRVSQIKPEIAL